jgi:hypothetical protein
MGKAILVPRMASQLCKFLMTAWLLTGLTGMTTAQNTNSAAPAVPPTNDSTATPPASTPDASAPGTSAWSTDLLAALKRAEAEKKMVVVEVSPDWNISGKKMETETFSDPKVQDQLKNAVLVKINPDASDDAKTMTARLKVFTYPSILILNYKGTVVAMATGFQDAGKFASFLSPYEESFQANPLGRAPPDLTPDDPLVKAEALKPEDDLLPVRTLFYHLLAREEITVHPDGGTTIFRRSAYCMVHPELARTDDDISGVSVRYDASRAKANFAFARIIRTDGQTENLDFSQVTDKPYYTTGDVSWDEHRLVIGSRKLGKGEIMDYEERIENTPRVPGHFELFWNTAEDRNVVVARELVLHFPAGMKLNKMAVRLDAPIQETKEPDGTITWQIKSSFSPQGSDSLFVANASETWSGYLFSTPWTWDDLASWYRGQISGRDTLSQDAKDVVQKIKLQTVDKADLPFKLRDWVKEHIRYYPVGFHLTSFQPHTADETFHYRCGDTRDTALLLQALLHEAGIASSPVLLNASYGHQLVAEQPMLTQFDHCLVAASDGAHDIYLDPVADVGEKDWLPLNDASVQGLKIGDTKAELVTLPPYRPRTGDSFSQEAVLSPDGSATVTSHYQFVGYYANYFRSMLGRLSEAKAQETFASLYKKEDEKLTGFYMSDPHQQGESFDVTCVSFVPQFATRTYQGLIVTLGVKQSTAEKMADSLARERIIPFRFYPSDPSVSHYTVTLPPGGKVLYKPDNLNLDTPFLNTTQSATQSGNQILWTTTYQTKDAIIPSAHQKEVKDVYREIKDHEHANFVLSLPHAELPPSAPEAKPSLPPTSPPTPAPARTLAPSQVD